MDAKQKQIIENNLKLEKNIAKLVQDLDRTEYNLADLAKQNDTLAKEKKFEKISLDD